MRARQAAPLVLPSYYLGHAHLVAAPRIRSSAPKAADERLVRLAAEPRPAACGLGTGLALRAALHPSMRCSTLRREVSLDGIVVAARAHRTVDSATHNAGRRPASCRGRRPGSPGLQRWTLLAALLAAHFACPPAEARRPFCVSSAHRNGGGAAPFGLAQSSQPRMTDRRRRGDPFLS